MSARSSLACLAAAVLALGACNAGDPRPEQAENGSRGNLTAAVTPPPASNHQLFNQADRQPARVRLDETDFTENAAAPGQADPEAVTRARFAGRWTDTGNCADAATFAANGTYLLADGTRGMWNVQDSRLVVQHSGGRAVVRLRRVDDGAVETIADDGSVGRSTRC